MRVSVARNSASSAGVLQALPAAEARLLDVVADAQHLGGRGDEADMHAAQLHPFAVAAAIDAVEWRAARGMRLEDVAIDLLARDLGGIEQRAAHQRGLDGAATPGLSRAPARRPTMPIAA